ncbi:hypothetical protein SAMN05892883_4422 [Jatrophihabitans sp. GAS493]|nr:hypothetical protein SAMN05892883_0011 [Jatrophihabitans sp. GAS493]SOD75215.1 hypothetical protein SAMN05892883_4422 [Jatrophihabitans sp. GAS493]
MPQMGTEQSRSTKFRIGAALLGAAALTFSLSACGHDSGKSASASTPATGSAPTAAGATSGTAATRPPGTAATSAPTAAPTASATPSTAPSSLLPGAEGQTAASGPNCRIASTSDVKTAFGAVVTKSVATTSGIGSPLCIFTLTSSNAKAGGSVTMSLATTTPAAFARAKAAATGAVPVSGVGDDAYLLPTTYVLHARKGNKALSIQATLGSPATAERAAQVKNDLIAVTKAAAAQL